MEYGNKFEKLIIDILKFNGYKMLNGDYKTNNQYLCDGLVGFEQEQFYIEVKYSQNLDYNINFLRNILVHEILPENIIFIIGGLINDDEKKLVEELNQQINIIDISNILYMVEKNEGLKSKLLEILPFSTEKITIVEPTIKLKSKNSRAGLGDADKLINELKEIKQGVEGAKTFEKICTNIVKYLFKDNLINFETQKSSNGNLYKFDLICKIKQENTSEIWQIIEKYFKTKYIVFEYKNYSAPITQKEVYTTEKYLYDKALRKVAIIIAKNGTDKNSMKAINGILRENGKLILVLTVNDLINMLNDKKNNLNSPSDYLSNILDKMMMNLEK